VDRARGADRWNTEGDVVLPNLSLPDSRGFPTSTTAHAAAPGVPIVVLSGLDDETLAVRAVQEGAQDYFVKDQVDGGTILRSMRYAIERQQLEAVRLELEHQRDEFSRACRTTCARQWRPSKRPSA
jgi:two-component system, cell cycle sensor histidine kinase and response regulator CckA